MWLVTCDRCQVTGTAPATPSLGLLTTSSTRSLHPPLIKSYIKGADKQHRNIFENSYHQKLPQNPPKNYPKTFGLGLTPQPPPSPPPIGQCFFKESSLWPILSSSRDVSLSIYLSVCLSPFHVNFFKASHWPSGQMIRSWPLIGQPPPPPNPKKK